MFFIWFLIIPITTTLRDIKTNTHEVFLSAPIKPSDILLGEFVGKLPFYAIAITIVVGFFTAILSSLGIDFIQMRMIILVFILIFLSAQWIGTVIAALLRTKLGKTARGKDIGKALAMLLALPMVAIMYALMGGGLGDLLINPNANETVKTIFSIFLRVLPHGSLRECA